MIYIAGPFSTEQERASLEKMITLVRKRYPLEDLYIPMDFKVEGDFQKLDGTWNLPNHEWAKKVYEADVEHLLSSRMVFAMYCGRIHSSGSIWEIGYACGKEIPVILYIPKWASNEMSLMVLNGVYGYIDENSMIYPFTPKLLKSFNQK